MLEDSVESLSKTLTQSSTLVECDASEDSQIENAMKKIDMINKTPDVYHSVVKTNKISKKYKKISLNII